jgi:hypothetical protein
MTNPRENGDPLVDAIVDAADRLMRLIEGVALAAIGGAVLDNATALLELTKIERAISNGKRIKRRALAEPTARVGAIPAAKTGAKK